MCGFGIYGGSRTNPLWILGDLYIVMILVWLKENFDALKKEKVLFTWVINGFRNPPSLILLILASSPYEWMGNSLKKVKK